MRLVVDGSIARHCIANWPVRRWDLPSSADIAPGRYRTTSLSSFCSWSRLSGFGGSDIIDIDIPSGASAIVDIAPTDVGFETNGCGSWSLLAG